MRKPLMLFRAILSRVRLRGGDTGWERLCALGIRVTVQTWLFQRILRINGAVPWPVHWTSHVSFHRNIQRAAPTQHIGMSPGTYVQALNGLRFGRNLRLGPGSKIISADHALDDYSRHIAGPPIVLGDNVWIGANAVILPGVVLGNHVVVGAGAVVTKSFAEDDILIAGVPARKVRDLPPYSGSDQKRVGSEG